ncbi:MAG: flavodoxin family protein [Negativicutes bacterium]|nr:flavodoxin family protein [Negativicutes bacterium]
MKVLGLVASPRRVGNSEIIVKEMMSALPDDWDKEMLQMNDLKLERCKACYACLPKEKRCVLNDDLNFFLDCIKDADKVIIAAPVYFLGQHTSLKLVNDRMISIQNNTEEYATGKQCVIVIPHTVADWEGYAREATMHFARFLNLNVTGSMIIRATLPGDVATEDSLSDVRKLAKSLVNNTAVDFIDEEKVYCPDCGSSLLQIFHQGKWRCVMCASSGKWTAAEGKFSLSKNASSHRRFTLEGMTEHGHVLDSVKEEYIRRKDEVYVAQKRYKTIDMWKKIPSKEK